ncbi:MAG: hypothetical protein ACP5MT_02155, partial [Candidatus Acidifodinimicrobium sp.]
KLGLKELIKSKSGGDSIPTLLPSSGWGSLAQREERLFPKNMEGEGWIWEGTACGSLLLRVQASLWGHICFRRWRSVHNEINLKAMLYNELLKA